MKILLLAVLSTFGIAASAAPVIDQSNFPGVLSLPDGTGNTASGFGDDNQEAQVFTVGLTGQLTRFDLVLKKQVVWTADQRLEWQVRSTTAGGEPNAILASGVEDASFIPDPGDPYSLVAFDLGAAAIPVTAGEGLAIVLTNTINDDFAGDILWGMNVHNSYAAGHRITRPDPSVMWSRESIADHDLFFVTYVDPTLSTPGPTSIGLLAGGLALLAIRRRRELVRSRVPEHCATD